MPKCEKCGKMVKAVNVLTWGNRNYGKECWKKVALPEIEAKRKALQEQWEKEHYAETVLMVEVMKKTLKTVRSAYKYEVLESMIQQFEEKDWLSPKQLKLAWKMFNQKQDLAYHEMEYELGEIGEKDILDKRLLLGTPKARKDAIKRIIELGWENKDWSCILDEFM